MTEEQNQEDMKSRLKETLKLVFQELKREKNKLRSWPEKEIYREIKIDKIKRKRNRIDHLKWTYKLLIKGEVFWAYLKP